VAWFLADRATTTQILFHGANMSVVSVFCAISQEQLNTFLATPSSLSSFLDSSNDDTDESASSTSIDQSADGIGYLLAQFVQGNADSSVVGAVNGGKPTAVSIGYSAVRYLTSFETAIIARALSVISPDALAARFSSEAMIEESIQPDGLWDDGEEALNYLLHHYDRLVKFYQAAAANKMAVLQYES
jgi:hypothetical protein